MRTLKLIPILGIAFLMLATSLNAQRRSPRAADDDGRPIRSLEVTVEDMSTGRFLQPLRRGDTIVIAPGQQIRLRMTGEVGANTSTRYPATRFEPNDNDSRHVRVDKINPEVGSIIVTGLNPNEGPGALRIHYVVTDPMPVGDEREREGNVYVRVEGATTAPPPQGSPGQAPGVRGVTLYSDEYFRGRSQTFNADDPDFRDNVIQNDSVSSVRVDPGCRVTLYEDTSYGGRAAVLERDAETLRGTGISNDAVSSIRVDCRGVGGAVRDRGINVYSDVGFRGNREFMAEGEYGELRGRVGNDSISSIEISQGCRAILYTDAGFRGRSWEITDNVSSMASSPVGNDSVSSIRVQCSR